MANVSGRPRADVWEHYNLLDESHVQCRFCYKTMFKNHSRCRQHLATCEGDVDPDVREHYANATIKLKSALSSYDRAKPGNSASSSSSSSSNTSDSDESSVINGKIIYSSLGGQGRPRGDIWDHYVPTEKGLLYPMCRYCHKTSYANTSRQKKHLVECTGEVPSNVREQYAMYATNSGGSSSVNNDNNRGASKNGQTNGGTAWAAFAYKQRANSRLKSSDYLKMKLNDRGVALGYIYDTYERCLHRVKGHQWADVTDKIVTTEILDDIWNAVIETTIGCDDLYDKSMKDDIPEGMKKRKATTTTQYGSNNTGNNNYSAAKRMRQEQEQHQQQLQQMLPLPAGEQFTHWITNNHNISNMNINKASQESQSSDQFKTPTSKASSTASSPPKPGPKSRKNDSGKNPNCGMDELPVRMDFQADPSDCILPESENNTQSQSHQSNQNQAPPPHHPLPIFPTPSLPLHPSHHPGVTGVATRENEKSIYDFYLAYQDKGLEWVFQRTFHYGINRTQLQQIVQHYGSTLVSGLA